MNDLVSVTKCRVILFPEAVFVPSLQDSAGIFESEIMDSNLAVVKQKGNKCKASKRDCEIILYSCGKELCFI